MIFEMPGPMGWRKERKPMMSNYSLYQLVTVIIMKHLNELTDVYQEEFVVYRMENLDRQHETIREYRELSGEYAELIDQIKARDGKKLSDESFDKLKRLVTLRASETERFHYLAERNDARRMFEISQGNEGGRRVVIGDGVVLRVGVRPG
jgi:hypothetical protein